MRLYRTQATISASGRQFSREGGGTALAPKKKQRAVALPKSLRAIIRALHRRIPSDRRYLLPHGELLRADALEFLTALPRGCADLVFLDPPFNLGKAYGRKGPSADLLEETLYYEYMGSVLSQCADVLRPGGALYLYHLPRWGIKFGGLLGTRVAFRHWIAISMKNGFARGKRLYPAHYALLFFTKGEPRVFRRPKVEPLRCHKCHELARDYGGYTRYVQRGINLSDVWDDLSPVRHRNRKHRTANELTIEIPRRVVRISGVRGGIFVDPFAGAGTSLVAATEAGMWLLAADRDRQSCELMHRRLSATD